MHEVHGFDVFDSGDEGLPGRRWVEIWMDPAHIDTDVTRLTDLYPSANVDVRWDVNQPSSTQAEARVYPYWPEYVEYKVRQDVEEPVNDIDPSDRDPNRIASARALLDTLRLQGFNAVDGDDEQDITGTPGLRWAKIEVDPREIATEAWKLAGLYPEAEIRCSWETGTPAGVYIRPDYPLYLEYKENCRKENESRKTRSREFAAELRGHGFDVVEEAPAYAECCWALICVPAERMIEEAKRLANLYPYAAEGIELRWSPSEESATVSIEID